MLTNFIQNVKISIYKRLTSSYPDKHLSSEGLVNYAKECVKLNTIYIWGGLGQEITVEYLNCKAQDYPNIFTPQMVSSLLDQCNSTTFGFDCSGLLKCYLMGGLSHFLYDKNRDLNCLGLFNKAKVKGEILSLPEKPGVCLYLEGHTGIYEGNGLVIESTPNPLFGNGVVRTHINDRQWTNWYELPWIRY